MDKWLDDNLCTACAACANICPKEAIKLNWDDNGFAVPEIDQELCIECGQCSRICPVKKSIDNNYTPVATKYDTPDVYAVWSKDKDTRYNSTSGGAFSEFARTIFVKGGCAVGAIYNDNHLVEHAIVYDEEGLTKIRQSKYIQSDIGFVFKEVKSILATGRLTLFCGSPCQIAGLYAYLGKDYDNLITVDFICRGSNSPKAYRLWLNSLENQYESRVRRVWFKNKEEGWNKFSTRVDFENGRIYRKTRYEDLFMRSYLEKNLFIRPSCTNCQFKGIPREADLTLADFWKIDKALDEDLGTSMVVVNSAKGQSLFDEASERLHVHKRSYEEALKGNACLTTSVKTGKYSAQFFELLNQGIDYQTAFRKIASEDEPLLSVVIPLVKPNDSICNTVEDILSQKYAKIEVILANVTENTAFSTKLDGLASKYPSVKHIKLKGDYITARNIGLQNVQGAYIHFAEPEFTLKNQSIYKQIISQMIANDVEVYCYAWYEADKDGNFVNMVPKAFSGTGDRYAYMKSLLSDTGFEDRAFGYGSQLWNKVFKTSALKAVGETILFEKSAYGIADFVWLTNIAVNIKTAMFNSIPIYNHTMDTEKSILPAGFSSKYYFERINATLDLVGKLDERVYTSYTKAFLSYEIDIATIAKQKGFKQLYDDLLFHMNNYYESSYTQADLITILLANKDTEVKLNVSLSNEAKNQQIITKANADLAKANRDIKHWRWMYDKEKAKAKKLYHQLNDTKKKLSFKLVRVSLKIHTVYGKGKRKTRSILGKIKRRIFKNK